MVPTIILCMRRFPANTRGAKVVYMSTNKPDIREARHLLSVAVAGLYTDHFAQAREAAADRLLQAFGEVAPSQEAGSVVSTGRLSETDRGPLRCLTFSGKIRILVGYYPANDKFIFYRQNGQSVEELGTLSLAFSPLAGEFYSDQPDTYLVPTPGEPLPTRSPVAVLIEKATQVAKTELKRQEERLLR